MVPADNITYYVKGSYRGLNTILGPFMHYDTACSEANEHARFEMCITRDPETWPRYLILRSQKNDAAPFEVVGKVRFKLTRNYTLWRSGVATITTEERP